MRTRDPSPCERRARVRLLVLAAALPVLMTACAPVPEWQDKASLHAVLPEQLSATQTAGLGAWPSEQWWLRYKDPQLNALIEEALQGAPDMAAAAARVQQAEALLGVEAAALQPQVAGQGQLGAEKYSYNYLTPAAIVPHGMNDTGRVTLNLQWSLDFWGKYRSAVQAAHGELAARQADAAQARLLLVSGIASAYAELLRLSASAQTLQQSVQLRTTTVALFQERFTHGLENQGSVSSARARLAVAQAEWAQIQEQLGLQRNRIAALVGASPERGAQLVVPQAQLAQPWQQQWTLPENLPLHLLGRRPDVVAARWQAQALEAREAAQQAAFYPDVNLSAFIGVQALGIDMLTRNGSSVAGVGPAINLPIFSGGRLRAQLAAVRAQYDEAVALYQQTLQRALQEVADNAISQRALQQQLQSMHNAVQAATEAHRVARNRYEGGLANYLEVLSAEDQLLASVRQLVDVQSRALSLDIALHRALGGGWQARSAGDDGV